MTKVKATVHGAISIVNAIPTGKGATLGITPKVEAVLEDGPGTGITIESKNKDISSKLITKTIEKIVTKKELAKTKFHVILDSEIPTGYGLKSSSAISSVVALACAKLTGQKTSDLEILLAGVNASLEAKVSLTGAYDDAYACYFGGFAVTDNYRRKIICSKKAPTQLKVVIFIPKSRKRGDIKKLKTLGKVFERAWTFARNSDYWNAMILNGFATSVILNSEPKIISDLIMNGAVGASISGNGPAIAAVAKKTDVSKVKRVFSSLEGKIVVSGVNNTRAEVHEL